MAKHVDAATVSTSSIAASGEPLRSVAIDAPSSTTRVPEDVVRALAAQRPAR